MKTPKKVADHLETIFLFPLFGGITTTFGVLAGYLGAHYDKEIVKDIAPAFWPGWQYASGPSFFWLFTILFGVSFSGTFWAQARNTGRVTDKMQSVADSIHTKTDLLRTSSDELDFLVRQLHTLPPIGFLESYRQAILESASSYFFAVDKGLSEKEGLAMSIRVQLMLIMRLAMAFHSDGQSAIYGCNIMLFVPSDTLNNKREAESIQKILKFIDRGVSVERLDGVLALIPILSVSSGSDKGPDTNLRPFALPIPKLTENERNNPYKNGVLPGAPDAFVSGIDAVIETKDDWLEKTSSIWFSMGVQREMQTFFDQSKTWIQSFVSIPLYIDEASEDQPFAVLNIHRNLPNNSAAEKMELFSPMLVPIERLLCRLLLTYKQAGSILNDILEN